MKKCISVTLAVFLLLTCLLTGIPAVNAAGKVTESREIAIVFDNSGSMYVDDYNKPIKAWSQATYAMEVFASMLNKGDVLTIYPMHPIKVGSDEYTMDKPLKITDSSQASKIRDIYTPKALITPIESVDRAIEGLQKSSLNKKYLIVLTDGDVFYKDGKNLKTKTKKELDARFKKADKDMTMMYLGIGSVVTMPDTANSEYFLKEQAKNTADVLSILTSMCNRIFGRDTLPANRIKNKKTVEFDISMNKLIVFVQGKDVSGLKVTGPNGEVGTKVSSASTKYSEKGCGNYESVTDTSLQGAMITYENCAAGTYNIEYSGNAENIEIYYEPNADLDFVFTDAAGNAVDPNALYEGDYKVSFGMKDGKTGQLISSDLLGEPHYEGAYYINGQEYAIKQDGYSGEVSVPLMMGDTFDANLTVTYLSGYTIRKDSTDFGWPDGGLTVASRPAGDLTMEVSGGDKSYSVLDLEGGSPFIVKFFYKGEQLVGEELKATKLTWAADKSNAEIKAELADDHYKLTLHYKNPEKKVETTCGECKLFLEGAYTAKGSDEAKTQAALVYTITEDLSYLKMEMIVTDDYIVMAKIDETRPIEVKLTVNGKPLTKEQFEKVEFKMDCGGINHKITPDADNSRYLIQLQSTEGIAEQDYPIKASATFTDPIGRTSDASAEWTVTMSLLPLWLKWLIALLILLLLFIIIWIILHIKVLPTKAHITKRGSVMYVDGEDVTKNVSFDNCTIKKGRAEWYVKHGSTKTGLVMDVKPGSESYLYKKHEQRSAEVKNGAVTRYGNAIIQEASIGSYRFALNEETNKLERTPKSDKPFLLKNNMVVRYSGVVNSPSGQKTFQVSTKLNFKKKK